MQKIIENEKEWKVIVRGEIEVDADDGAIYIDNKYGPEWIGQDFIAKHFSEYNGKTIEIAVRIIDETKE